jgi:hypothetical protein
VSDSFWSDRLRGERMLLSKDDFKKEVKRLAPGRRGR